MEMCNVASKQRDSFIIVTAVSHLVFEFIAILCTKQNFIVSTPDQFFPCANKKASLEKWHEMLLNAESDRFKLLTRVPFS